MIIQEGGTKFAFAIYDGVIQETYEIQSWFEADQRMLVDELTSSVGKKILGMNL